MKLDFAIQLLRENKKTIHNFGVKSLAIFGSTVRREATALSDIDILVSYENPPTFDQYIETKFFLEDLCDQFPSI